MRTVSLIAAVATLLTGATAASMAQAQAYNDDDQGNYSQDYPRDQGGQDQYGQPYNSGAAPQGYYQNQQDYERQRQQYDDAYSDYQNRQSDYDSERQAYEHRRARYERERADYDARYGVGAFDRYYRIHPDEYDARFGSGAYDRDFGGDYDDR